MYGRSSGGRGGRGAGYGYGFGGGAAVQHSVEVPVPQEAIGLVMGSKGRNIKEMQGTPDIRYVSLDNASGMLKIGGSVEAVGAVEMRVRGLLNRFRTGGGRPKEVRLHIDLRGGERAGGRLRFLPGLSGSRGGGAPTLAEFGAFASGREYFRLGMGEGDLAGAFRGLGISQPRREAAGSVDVRVPLDQDAMCASFERFLRSLGGLPRNAEVGVEVRFGVTAFHTLSPFALEERFSPEQFTRLVPHTDYKTQFSTQLNFRAADLEAAATQEGFDVMERDRCSVVHVVDVQAGENYAAIFVEPEGGDSAAGDPRLSPEKRRELERISQCCTPEDVLELPPGASPAATKKAYFKKSLMVHPDKNAFAGATEATKVLTQAREDLEAHRRQHLSPPLFSVGEAPKAPPKLIRLEATKQSHLQEDVVELDGGLGIRVVVISKAETDDPGMRDFLEQQWKCGTIAAGSTLKADRRFSIDSVRLKESHVLSDGSFHLKLSTVRQKALEGAGRFHENPEAEIRCPALLAAIEELRGAGRSGGGSGAAAAAAEARALQHFRELVARARVLAEVLSTCHAAGQR